MEDDSFKLGRAHCTRCASELEYCSAGCCVPFHESLLSVPANWFWPNALVLFIHRSPPASAQLHSGQQTTTTAYFKGVIRLPIAGFRPSRNCSLSPMGSFISTQCYFWQLQAHHSTSRRNDGSRTCSILEWLQLHGRPWRWSHSRKTPERLLEQADGMLLNIFVHTSCAEFSADSALLNSTEWHS